MVKGQTVREREAPSPCSCLLNGKLQASRSQSTLGFSTGFTPPVTFSLWLPIGNTHVLGLSKL